RRGALPLRALRRRDLRSLRRLLLLAAEVHREATKRRAGTSAFLAYADRLQSDLLPNAHIRATRHAASHLDILRGPGMGPLEHAFDDRSLHYRALGTHLHD